MLIDVHRFARSSSRRSRVLLAGALATACASCESRDTQVSDPRGRDAFSNYVAIGTGLSMGAQSAGVVYTTQLQAWPTVLARMAGVDFALPLLRSPGCTPPFIAPLGLGRFLSGAAIASPDSSCAGALGAAAPPLNNLALAGATAWAALNLSPKLVAASPTRYDAGDRARYPLVLAATQTQMSAMLVKGPSFVSIELGFEEVLGAATSGLLVAATSYTQSAPWTFVPPSLFAPVYSAIVDSVKRSGARVALLTVPHVTRLYALRPAAELVAARAELATFGVTVAPDCNGSANFVFTGVLVPALALRALTAGAPQTFSCTDVPGAADAVLTPADVSALDAVVTQMNALIRQLAVANGWALADLDAVYADITAGRPSYRASEQLACVYPYGGSLSLDGVHPNATGHQTIANVVAQAVNETYGFTIPVPIASPIARAQLCP